MSALMLFLLEHRKYMLTNIGSWLTRLESPNGEVFSDALNHFQLHGINQIGLDSQFSHPQSCHIRETDRDMQCQTLPLSKQFLQPALEDFGYSVDEGVDQIHRLRASLVLAPYLL